MCKPHIGCTSAALGLVFAYFYFFLFCCCWFFPSCARVFIVEFAKSYGSDYALVYLYVYVGIYKIIH